MDRVNLEGRGTAALTATTGLLDEFKAFLFRGNVVDLAVAVVIGSALQAVVKSMTDDIIMPVLGIVGGAPDFSSNSFTINGSKFGWGNFVTEFLSFIIVAAVIFFFVIKPMNLTMSRVRVTKETTEGGGTVTETVVKDTQP